MSRRFRLGSVLRARQAQEDAARTEVVRARRDAAAAANVVRRQHGRLTDESAPSATTAGALTAALVARQSMAATLFASRRIAQQTQQQFAERITQLTDAAARRRSVEKLAERHAEARRLEDQATDQRVIDELAVTNAQRVAAREVTY
jgi:flagellar protein FliJ